MMDEKRYSVIELADQIGVPRTTINDWLGRYSLYIDFVMQGKRRVYTTSSVDVLKFVSELKNNGASSFEIEAALTKRFPVRGEPALPPEEEKGNPVQPEQASGVSSQTEERQAAQPDADHSEEFALIAKRQSDEIGRIIGESFQSMAAKMEALEANSRKNTTQLRLWFAFAAILLTAIAVVIAISIAKIQTLNHTNERILKDAASKEETLKALEGKTVSLIGGTETLQKSIATLEAGMEEQRKNFEKSLEESRKNLEATKNAEIARRDAEIALEREKFAAEKLNYLRNLERLSADNEEIVRDLTSKLEKIQNEMKNTGSPSKDSAK